MAIDALQNFPGAKVVFDCRAAEVCESIQVNGMEDTPESRWSTRAGQLIDQTRGSERVAVTASAGITCLSNAMIRLLQARHPDVLADKFRLVPCCTRVDDFIPAALQRDSLREELGLQGKFVVTYLGSLNWLHLPAEMIRMYRIIRSLLPHAHFLAITTDPTKMQAFIQEAGLSSEEVTIRSVPPQDVPRWVAISDLGLCLLRTTERDRVCSPVKIAEYFSAGVPVIITPQQGDFSAIVSQQSLGVEVDLTEGDDQLTSRLRDFVLNTVQDPRAVRARCQQYAKAELSWSGITPRLAEWYHELLDLPREIPSLSGLSSDGDLP